MNDESLDPYSKFPSMFVLKHGSMFEGYIFGPTRLYNLKLTVYFSPISTVDVVGSAVSSQ